MPNNNRLLIDLYFILRFNNKKSGKNLGPEKCIYVTVRGDTFVFFFVSKMLKDENVVFLCVSL